MKSQKTKSERRWGAEYTWVNSLITCTEIHFYTVCLAESRDDLG